MSYKILIIYGLKKIWASLNLLIELLHLDYVEIINIYYINNAMAGAQRRKSGAKNKKMHRALKTRHYLRDHDQIHDDLKNE